MTALYHLIKRHLPILLGTGIFITLIHFGLQQMQWVPIHTSEIIQQQVVLFGISLLVFIIISVGYIQFSEQLGFIALAGFMLKMGLVGFFCYQQGWFTTPIAESIKQSFVFFYLTYLTVIVYIVVNLLKELDDKPQQEEKL